MRCPRSRKSKVTAEIEEAPWLGEQPYFPEEEFFKPIGEMVWNFGWLEQQLDFVLFSLLRPDDPRAIAIQAEFFKRKIDMFFEQANLHFKDGSKTEEIKKLHADLTRVNDNRNIIVHGRGISFTWPPLKIGVRKAERKKFGIKQGFFEPEEISAMANEMLAVGTALGQFRWEIVRTSPSAPAAHG
jgi:hypothetical protein